MKRQRRHRRRERRWVPRLTSSFEEVHKPIFGAEHAPVVFLKSVVVAERRRIGHCHADEVRGFQLPKTSQVVVGVVHER